MDRLMHGLPHFISGHVYILLLHMHVMLPCDTCLLYGFSIFLSHGSPCRLSVLLFHVIRYILYAWFPLLILLIPLLDTCSRYWYGYSRYWTWELLICYIWTSTSIDPVILFPLYCSRYIVPDILFPIPVISVSYTHLTLPTIYSV